MKLDDVIWSTQLQPEEYPNGVLRYMSKKIIRTQVGLRGFSGVPMTPSPLFEAHVRTKPVKERGARHNIGEDAANPERESDATDYFIPDTHVARMNRFAQADPTIGGIGFYFDTVPSVLVHIDGRPERVLWLRVDGEYIDYKVDPVRFMRVFAEELEKLPTQVA